MYNKLFFLILAVIFVIFSSCGSSPPSHPIDIKTEYDTIVPELDITKDAGDLPSAEEETDLIFPEGDFSGEDFIGEEFESSDEDITSLDIPPECSGEKFGSPWCPCNENTQCLSGYCVETLDEKVCTMFCSPDNPCPEGWECIQISMTELIYACVFVHPKLCTPCKEDYQCQGQYSKLENYCYSFGDIGSFCTGECSEKVGCPGGYECKDLTVSEKQVKQCMPSDGTCDCTSKLVKQGSLNKTDCYKTNENGKCKGETFCGIDAVLEPCTAKEPEKEKCDGQDNNCDGMTDEGLQFTDCFVENTYGKCPGKLFCVSGKELCQGKEPGPEVCDGQDNNCDGSTDEYGALGCTNYFKDKDGDMWGDENDWICACKPQEGYPTKKYPDCNDEDKNINPGADEYCNKIDDNCNGEIDEIGAKGCMKYYKDLDGDGYGIEGDYKCMCKPQAPYTSLLPGDCNDKKPEINIAAEEKCDGIDNNCNGEIDESGSKGCVNFYFDYDSDGFGVTDNLKCLCQMDPPYKAIVGGDCDDKDFGVKPGATEMCNFKDDDCNGTIDDEKAQGCKEYCLDEDEDGYGLKDKTKCFCKASDKYTDEKCKGDCDDTDEAIHPDSIEVCDEKDNNCDGFTDYNPNDTPVFGCKNYYYDADGDGYGSKMYKCLCHPEGYFTADNPNDCNDGNALINPGAKEVCGNQIDENCNQMVNEDMAIGCSKYYKDNDGDGYGDPESMKCLCYAEGDYIIKNGNDCNDNNKFVHPDAPELCGNGLDDDCDGNQNDPGATNCQWFYLDEDADGWGIEGNGMCLCYGENFYTAKKQGDCKDNDENVNPGLPEKCNGFDDNCDNKIDGYDAIDCITYFWDNDGDGYGIAGLYKCACKPEGKYQALEPGDCNDNDKDVNPGAQEICKNAKNDDCDSEVDEEGSVGCVTYYKDLDGDTFGDMKTPRCLCEETGLYNTTNGQDCDDQDKDVKPNAVEKCNGKDDNCDEIIDPENSINCTTYYLDNDGDTYGDANNSKCLCAPKDKYSTKKTGDCDDNNPDIGPGGTEKCNGSDDDCDGFVDEENALGCIVYYLDEDADGYGLTLFSRCLCKSEGLYNTINKGDCDDKDKTVSPGEIEKCNNRDDDCDGDVDEEGAEGCNFWCKDADQDGHGEEISKKCLCHSDPPWNTTLCDDCDDTSYYIVPGAGETCDDKDNNCNGITDEEGASGCLWYYIDKDHDLYGLPSPKKCLCAPGDPPNTDFTGLYLTDCDDNEPNTHPGAVEKCDSKDNDCNGFTDEPPLLDCNNYYFDGDGDGYGVGPTFQCMCAPKAPFTSTNANDCNDINASINPGMKETCNDIDDDCDGVTDNEGSTGCKNYYYDNDIDGFGNENDGKCLCKPWGKYTDTLGGDCDDANKLINPNAKELCDNIDNDCSGVVDDGEFYDMCGPVVNGVPGCSEGKCAPKCNSGWYDLDLNYQTGCECPLDQWDTQGTGNTMGTAYNLGSISDTGAMATTSGNIVPDSDVDWFRIQAVDIADTSCDKFKFSVKFTSPQPNTAFGYIIYREDSQLCSSQTQLTEVEYSMNQKGFKSTPGECPCISEGTGTDTPEYNHCEDDTATFYIKVFKIQSGSTCTLYQLSITNG
jgi:hypothetical protein